MVAAVHSVDMTVCTSPLQSITLVFDRIYIHDVYMHACIICNLHVHVHTCIIAQHLNGKGKSSVDIHVCRNAVHSLNCSYDAHNPDTDDLTTWPM